MRKNTRWFWPFLLCFFLLGRTAPAGAAGDILSRLYENSESVAHIHVEASMLVNNPAKSGSAGSLRVRGIRAAKINKTGGAIVLDASGILVTNAHIVYKGARITAGFEDTGTSAM